MNLKFFLVTALSIASSLPCIAQIDRYDGFVITHEGDTIRGLIEDWGPVSNTKRLYILKSGENKLTSFAPTQAKAYYLNGTYYESKIIINTKKESQQMFVMPLVKGKFSLYKYGKMLYAVRDTLAYNLIITKGNSKNNNLARGLVKLLMRDCQSINVDSAVIREANLRELALRYNGCVGSSSTQYKKAPAKKGRVTFGVFAGENVSSLKMSNDVQWMPPYRNYSFKPAHSYMFGVSADVGMRDTPSLYLELAYFNTNFSGSTSLMPLGEKYYNASFLRIAAGTRIKFRARIVQPYIGFGLSQFFATKMSGLEKNSASSSNYSQFVPNVRSSNPQGLWLSAGLQRQFFDRFGIRIEGRIEGTTGFIEPAAVDATSQTPFAIASPSSLTNNSILISFIF